MAIDEPERLWGFAEAAARTAGGFGALWEAMIERGNRVSFSFFLLFFREPLTQAFRGKK